MILSITPNPAIDRTLILPGLVPGDVHRAQKTMLAAGGKGLNVARTIHTLGGNSLCMGFVGGHSGRLFEDLARKDGLQSSWTWIDSETRTCTILVPADQDATVINEPGPPLSGVDWKRLQQAVEKQLPLADLVCISGSFPLNSASEDVRGLFRLLVDSGKRVWVDSSGSALETALTYPDICIKVNDRELSHALGLEIKDLSSAQRILSGLVERRGCPSVITLGSNGAILATKEGRWYARGPRVDVISTAGSGDSFLGGLVNALGAGKGWPDVLRDAVAAGTANALSAGGGQFTRREFESIGQQVQIQSW